MESEPPGADLNLEANPRNLDDRRSTCEDLDVENMSGNPSNDTFSTVDEAAFEVEVSHEEN